MKNSIPRLQTTFSVFLDIFYPPNFGCLSALSYRVTRLAKNVSNLAQTAGEPLH